MKESTKLLSRLRYCAPPPKQPLREWCEENIYMGVRQPTAFPGRFRVENSPYLGGIMDALDDPTTRTLVIEAGAQTGKTTLAYAWLAHAVAADPGPMLICYPSEDMARSNSATRIQPTFEDSPTLREFIPANRREGWQLLQYRFPGCHVHLTGANSPAQLASRPIRYLLCDETDKFPAEATRGEADAVSLAIQRTKSFWNAQILLLSTPTTPTGLIHKHYLRGDQREYEVPCPHCGEFIRIRWKCVKWPENKPEEAHIECPVCGAAWTEHERRAAIRRGRWKSYRPDGEAERGVVSFHLPSLLALWVSLPDLAQKFLRAKTDPTLLQDFANSDLAEPFVPVDAKVSAARLKEREGDYDAGHLRWAWDDEETPVFGGVDVQKDYLVVVIRQFRRDTCASAQIIHTTVKTFAELDGLLAQYHAKAACIDARYRSNEVYEASLTYPGFWPAVGVSGFRIPAIFEQQTRDIDEGKRGMGGRIVNILVANSNALLDMLSDRIDGRDGAPEWEIPRGASNDKTYVRQMTAMYRSNGLWVNPRKLPEHYMDAEKLTLLAAEYDGIRPSVAPPPAEC